MSGSTRLLNVGLQGRRILIVEDGVLLAMELQDLLERQGCVVLGPVNTVARALAVLDREQPDAVLLDLDLGGQRSTQVVATLSARHVPFVVVTGYAEIPADEPELQTARRISKPVDHRVLLRVLLEVCLSERR